MGKKPFAIVASWRLEHTVFCAEALREEGFGVWTTSMDSYVRQLTISDLLILVVTSRSVDDARKILSVIAARDPRTQVIILADKNLAVSSGGGLFSAEVAAEYPELVGASFQILPRERELVAAA